MSKQLLAAPTRPSCGQVSGILCDIDVLEGLVSSSLQVDHAPDLDSALNHDHAVQELAYMNQQYEERFGHIFIVCASGKTANEMLAIIQSRHATLTVTNSMSTTPSKFSVSMQTGDTNVVR